MNKKILITVGIAILIIAAIIVAIKLIRPAGTEGEALYRVPRVLIITTGKDGTGTLPEGALLTMESFIRHGAYARINTRDALLDDAYLAEFDILLLLTAIDYHDADRQYSLTYMDDIELEMLSSWVHNGGVLIAGDNIGRNLRNGSDRISIFGRLEPDNWPISETFGVMMSERNMEGFTLVGDIADTLRGELLPELGPGSWILVPDSLLNENVRILAAWENDSLQFPALVMNHFGDGFSILLPSSYLLHPSNEGGHWSAVQIDAFCQMVLNEFYSRFPARIGFNPWPNAHPAAFAVSLNSDGNHEDYQRTLKLLGKKNITPTLFVSGDINVEVRNMLEMTSVNIQSIGLRKTNMRDLSFAETVFQIEMNERHWNNHFTGFRFPFTLNSFWGMDYLHRKQYIYESSIGVDHTQSFLGSLFPYHLPIFQDENYHVLNIIEVGPMALDDYFYFRMIQEEEIINHAAIFEKSLLYDEYLRQFWKYNALASGGMMVYLGHPLFTGFNDTTLSPLTNIIDTVRKDGGWITTMEEIASRWMAIDNVCFYVKGDRKDKNRFFITVKMPERETLNQVTLKLEGKPRKVSALKGGVKTQKHNENWFIIFDATNGQKIELSF